MSTAAVIFAHRNPSESKVNRFLLRHLRLTLPEVDIYDLKATYPNYQIDVEMEQAILRQHDIIILQFPFYWYSSPAILKEWLDAVFTQGFAYGDVETALQDKKLLLVVSTGGDDQAYTTGGYNHFSMSTLLTPFQAIANITGMEFVPPFFIHEADSLSQIELDNIAKHYENYIKNLL